MDAENIRILTEPIALAQLKEMAQARFGDMVKAVVDVEKKIMAVGGEMHADEEQVLLANGCAQQNVWGINIYVDKPLIEAIEFDSMINIRPRQNNRSRSVEDVELQEKIKNIVVQLIQI